MKKIISFIFALSFSIFLLGCNQGTTQTTDPTSAPKDLPQTSTTPATNTISIENFAFTPSSIVVAPGTTVTWTNNDSASHIIKSETFESENLSKGQSFSFTFKDAGTFDYFCSIHPSMKGQIVVK